MRKYIVRIISFILIVSFLMLTPQNIIHAEPALEVSSIQINTGEDSDPKSYSVIVRQNELFIKSRDLEAITRFRVGRTQDKRLMFMLGQKQVFVDPGQKTLTFRGYTTTINEPIYHEKDFWLPMSQLLPWLNTYCNVEDGILSVTSDPISIWEVKNSLDLNLTKYLFDVEEEYNGRKSAAIQMFSMFLFDTILKGRLYRAIPYKGDSLQDYITYMDTFREFAVDDYLKLETVENTVSLLDGFDKINTITKYFQENLSGASNDAGNILEEVSEALGEVNEASDLLKLDVGNALGKVSETLEEANEASDIVKLKELASAMTYIEASYLTSEEYYLTFKYVYRADKPGRTLTVAQEAAKQSYKIYRSVQEATEYAIKDYLFNSLLSSLESGAEKKLLDNKVIYLKAIDTVLGLTWPINKAAQETAHLPVYVNIQHDALDSYHQYESKANPAQDDITAIRLSAMMFLKAGKKAVEAKEALLDRFGGKGLMDWRLQEYNELLSLFALSAAATVNDSASDKKEISNTLLQLFETITISKEVKEESGIIDEQGESFYNLIDGMIDCEIFYYLQTQEAYGHYFSSHISIHERVDLIIKTSFDEINYLYGFAYIINGEYETPLNRIIVLKESGNGTYSYAWEQSNDAYNSLLSPISHPNEFTGDMESAYNTFEAQAFNDGKYLYVTTYEPGTPYPPNHLFVFSQNEIINNDIGTHGEGRPTYTICAVKNNVYLYASLYAYPNNNYDWFQIQVDSSNVMELILVTSYEPFRLNRQDNDLSIDMVFVQNTDGINEYDFIIEPLGVTLSTSDFNLYTSDYDDSLYFELQSPLVVSKIDRILLNYPAGKDIFLSGCNNIASIPGTNIYETDISQGNTISIRTSKIESNHSFGIVEQDVKHYISIVYE